MINDGKRQAKAIVFTTVIMFSKLIHISSQSERWNVVLMERVVTNDYCHDKFPSMYKINRNKDT